MVYVYVVLYIVAAMLYSKLAFNKMNGAYWRDINRELFSFPWLVFTSMLFPIHLIISLLVLLTKFGFG